MHRQLLFSIILSAILSLFIFPYISLKIVDPIIYIADFLGDLFIGALKMMIVPLIISSLVSGLLKFSKEEKIAPLAIKTILYYLLTGLIAVIIGLVCVNLIKPGKIDSESAQSLLGQAQINSENFKLFEKIEDDYSATLLSVVKKMFPHNIFSAATDNGQLLGIITFSIIFGLVAGKLPNRMRTHQNNFWESFHLTIQKITEYIISYSPIGVFGLTLPIFFSTGIESLQTLSVFFFTVLLALFIHLFLALLLILKVCGNVNPLKHLKEMTPVLVTAFSTASSSGTLPTTIDIVQKRANVSKKTAALTLPLGATINMDGTALYECVVVIFISQLYASITGMDLTLANQLVVVFLSLTTSIGVAGIPSASIVAIAIILPAVGLPVEAIGIIWSVDRLLDMCRTSVNVFSDTIAAVVISKSQGEEPYSKKSSII